MLSEQKGSASAGAALDLRYMLFRLDFNEYYHVKKTRAEELQLQQKRGGVNGAGLYDEDDGMDDAFDDIEGEEQDDDDEEDDDEDEDEEGDDDEEEEEEQEDDGSGDDGHYDHIN